MENQKALSAEQSLPPRTELSAPKMDDATLAALRGSIGKWEAIVAGTGQDSGCDNCPLCKKFYEGDENRANCEGCPVESATGQPYCDGSPYDQFRSSPRGSDARQEAAKVELEFLRGLLPEGAA
jgi:hypothetical protein